MREPVRLRDTFTGRLDSIRIRCGTINFGLMQALYETWIRMHEHERTSTAFTFYIS